MENENYPENVEAFIDKFATEQDCIEYVSQLRWSNGFICPYCKSYALLV